jgi:hypothetical protein
MTGLTTPSLGTAIEHDRLSSDPTRPADAGCPAVGGAPSSRTPSEPSDETGGGLVPNGQDQVTQGNGVTRTGAVRGGRARCGAERPRRHASYACMRAAAGVPRMRACGSIDDRSWRRCAPALVRANATRPFSIRGPAGAAPSKRTTMRNARASRSSPSSSADLPLYARRAKRERRLVFAATRRFRSGGKEAEHDREPSADRSMRCRASSTPPRGGPEHEVVRVRFDSLGPRERQSERR